MFSGDFFKAQSIVSKEDIAALEAYNAEIKRGVAPSIAYHKTMRESSVAAQNLAKSAKNAAVDINAIPKASKAAAAGMNLLSGVINAGVSMAISYLISGIFKMIGAYDEMSQQAADATAKYEEQSSTLEDYKDKIIELKTELSSENLTYTEARDKRSQLLDIQKQLIDTYGAEAAGIDLVNGSLDDQVKKLDSMNKLKRQQWENEVNKLSTGQQWQKWAGYVGWALLDTITFDWSFYDANKWLEDFENTTNIERIAEKFENFKESITLSGLDIDKEELEALKTQMDSYEGVSFKGNNMTIAGDAKTVANTITKIQTEVIGSREDLQGLNQDLKDIYISAEKIVTENWDTYNQAIEFKILDDDTGLEYYGKLTEAYEAYQEALKDGDEDAINKAKESYSSLLSDINNSDMNASFKKFFENMYPDISTIIEAWKFEVKIVPKIASNEDGLNDSINTLKDLTTDEINAAFDSNGAGVSKDQWKAITDLNAEAQANGLNLSTFLDQLREAGYLVSDLDKRIEETVNNTKSKYGDGTDWSKYFKDNSIDTEEELDLWNKVTEGINDAEEAMNAYAEATKNVDEMTVSIGNLKDTSEGLKVLESAFKEMDDDGRVSLDTLEDIKSTFGGSVDDIDSYIDRLVKAKSNSQDFKDALTDLTYGYINQKMTTEQLANADEAYIATLLEEVGVSNALEVAQHMIAVAKEKVKLETEGVADKTEDEVIALLNEEGCSDAARQALIELAREKVELNATEIDTSGDIEALFNLAKAAGIGAEALETLKKVKPYLSEDFVGPIPKDIISSIEDLKSGNFDWGWDKLEAPTTRYTNAGNKSKENLEKEHLEKARDYAEKVTDIEEDLVEKEADYAEKVADINEDLAEKEAEFAKNMAKAWEEEHLAQLEDGLEKQKDIIDRYKKYTEVIDFGLDHIEADDFSNREALLSGKLDNLKSSGSAMRTEFDRLANTIPNTAEEATVLANRIEELGSDMRDNVSLIRETTVELQKLTIDMANALIDDRMSELQHELDNIDKRIAILNSDYKDEYKYASQVLSMDMLLPAYSEFDEARRKKQRSDRELIKVEQETQNEINRIVTDSLERQAKANAKARAEERARLIEDMEKARKDAKKKLDEALKDLENARKDAKKKLADAHQDYLSFLDDNEIATTDSVQEISDIFANADIKLPEIDISSVDDAISKVRKKVSGIFDDGTKGGAIVNAASKYDGTPYIWGGGRGGDRSTLDCSGFVSAVLMDLGYIQTTYSADDFKNVGTKIDPSDMQPGDLLIFDYKHDGEADHVAFYAGDGKMWHSSGDSTNTKTPGKGVHLADFSDYYRNALVQVNRVYASGTLGGNARAGKLGLAGENYKPEILIDKETGEATYIDTPTVIDVTKTDVIGEKQTARLPKFADGTGYVPTIDDWIATANAFYDKSANEIGKIEKDTIADVQTVLSNPTLSDLEKSKRLSNIKAGASLKGSEIGSNIYNDLLYSYNEWVKAVNNGTAEWSLEVYEAYRDAFDCVGDLTYNMADAAVQAKQDSANLQWNNSTKWIEERNEKGDWGLYGKVGENGEWIQDSEVDAWGRVIAYYSAGGEFPEETGKLAEAKNSQINAKFKEVTDWIDERNEKGDWAEGDSESKAWQRYKQWLIDNHPKEIGRIKEADDKIFEADSKWHTDYIDERNEKGDWDLYGEFGENGEWIQDSEVNSWDRYIKWLETYHPDRVNEINEAKSKKVDAKFKEVTDWIDERNEKGDWAEGDSESKAWTRYIEWLETEHPEEVGKIKEAKKKLAESEKKDIDNQLSDIDTYIEERNHYGDWNKYNDTELKAVERQIGILKQAHDDGKISDDEYNEKLRGYNQRVYDLKKKDVDEQLSDIDDYIEERNHYDDWSEDGLYKSELDAVNAQIGILEQAHNEGKISDEEYYEKLRGYNQRVYDLKKKDVYDLISDIDDYIEERNRYNDWEAYGDTELNAIQRKIGILEQAKIDGTITDDEYAEGLKGYKNDIYTLGRTEVDKHLSNIDDYISARNFYGDWEKYGDSEVDAIKRQLGVLDEAYKLNLISYEDYTKKYAEYSQNLYSAAKNDIVKKITEMMDEYEEIKQDEIDSLNFKSTRYNSLKTLLQSYYDVTNAVADARREIDRELKASQTMYEYLNEETRELLFNQEDYNALNEELLNIQNEANNLQKEYQKDIRGASEETIAEITSQYQMQYETMMKQYEIAKAELDVAKKRQKLDNVLAERNVRMFINGQWQWVANTQNVIDAQNELAEAEAEKAKKESSLEQTNSINKFTEKQDAITTQINYIESDLEEVRKEWDEMQEMLNGESEDVARVLKKISKVSSPELKRVITTTGGDVETFSGSVSLAATTMSDIINSDLGGMSTDIGYVITDFQNLSIALQALEDKINSLDIDGEDSVENSRGFVKETIAKMRANSEQWLTASPEDRESLHALNQYLGESIGATYDEATGKWYSSDGKLLYSISSANGSSSASGSSPSKKTSLSGNSSSLYDLSGSGGSSSSEGSLSNGRVVQVGSDGNAPEGTKPGDIVRTAGGDYLVVKNNTKGASYNPATGLWSIKIDEEDADGTRYTRGGVTLMGEEGFEAFISGNGRLIPISQPTIGNIGSGGVVFNREQMANLRNLWDLSNLGKISPFVSSSNMSKQNTTIDNSIHINGLTVSEQGNEDWINGLRRYVATHK